MMMPYTKHYIKMASHAIYIDSDGVRTRRTDERSAARQVKMQVNSATDLFFLEKSGEGSEFQPFNAARGERQGLGSRGTGRFVDKQNNNKNTSTGQVEYLKHEKKINALRRK
ncbi:hypothetical protein Zmor_019336 [Zophobas morio]|uniref:Uncharacterized protein n=1 Tax=Zophobas morio TaxID=2755281 RepID=A0AA38HZE1_9CUCU|nr:hypothetical protein Zmor_019336 [Zophobas morio]